MGAEVQEGIKGQRMTPTHNTTPASNTCPFCTLQAEAPTRIRAQNKHAFLMDDGYPVTQGHSLIIPKRHIASFFDATEEERHAMLALVDEAKTELDAQYQPAGYNLGINDGPAAGQTVMHLHVHVIPRYAEEGVDPRGGVRWVVAEKAKYWD
ncbi:histidine triad (HIT) protein [Simiduia agarivorans SA1 = DSM 21679]|uniref:Histidine triad (HIT) protein n=2 Tax=Simiduia TaxID=447467 RepID=K4KH45_SIMAS|nr:histidine triad (HIT) protein [Simiduia agarivorans SA1 = DSM 21679]